MLNTLYDIVKISGHPLQEFMKEQLSKYEKALQEGKHEDAATYIIHATIAMTTFQFFPQDAARMYKKKPKLEATIFVDQKGIYLLPEKAGDKIYELLMDFAEDKDIQAFLSQYDRSGYN